MLPRRLTAEEIATSRRLTAGEVEEQRFVEDGLRRWYQAEYRREERKRLWRAIFLGCVIVLGGYLAVLGILSL